MAKITLYTRPGCSQCDKAKAFLVEKNIEFEELSIDVHKKRLLAEHPNLKELPVIFSDDKLIGNLNNLIYLHEVL